MVSGFLQFSSVHFSRSVVSGSLRPHESQHARPPCPLPAPGVHSDSRPWSQWCHPAISSSVVPFSSCPQSLPASESFPMSPKHWSFSFSIISSKEIPGLISFRMDWLDLLASLLQPWSLSHWGPQSASNLAPPELGWVMQESCWPASLSTYVLCCCLEETTLVAGAWQSTERWKSAWAKNAGLVFFLYIKALKKIFKFVLQEEINLY